MTIADAIREFLAPVQPDDCRHANLLILAQALKVSGPVVHHGQVVASVGEGEHVSIDFEARTFTRIPATETEAERDPTDAELAAEWGLPLASETPLTPITPPADTP